MMIFIPSALFLSFLAGTFFSMMMQLGAALLALIGSFAFMVIVDESLMYQINN
jgi:hypothetical protein